MESMDSRIAEFSPIEAVCGDFIEFRDEQSGSTFLTNKATSLPAQPHTPLHLTSQPSNEDITPIVNRLGQL